MKKQYRGRSKHKLHQRFVVLCLLGSFTAFLVACTREDPVIPTNLPVQNTSTGPQLPSGLYEYVIPQYPDHFLGGFLDFIDSTPADNPITNAGATLGRVLFYDRNLSIDRSISCASCHHQEHGFADAVVASAGHAEEHTRRNAMHLVNQSFVRRQFWDLRAQTLEQQVLMPIQDNVEMGMTLEGAVARVEEAGYYPELFTAAFGNDSITSNRMARAMAQFVRSIVSYRSRYDEGEQTNFANYTQLEMDGKDVFFNGITRCNQCHLSVNFFNRTAMNNGLDASYSDNGLGEVSGNAADNGLFKVPSLRNVELTGPYMHDGRFTTLEEVVEHYNSGVQPHPNLDDRLTVESQIGGTPLQMNMSEYDKQALVAFLKTLTDGPLIADVRFSDPFVH